MFVCWKRLDPNVPLLVPLHTSLCRAGFCSFPGLTRPSSACKHHSEKLLQRPAPPVVFLVIIWPITGPELARLRSPRGWVHDERPFGVWKGKGRREKLWFVGLLVLSVALSVFSLWLNVGEWYYYPAWQRKHFPGFGLDFCQNMCWCECVCICMRLCMRVRKLCVYIYMCLRAPNFALIVCHPCSLLQSPSSCLERQLMSNTAL